ncbi:metallophosphoesterase family protein [Nanoarchaeota archaeon]
MNEKIKERILREWTAEHMAEIDETLRIIKWLRFPKLDGEVCLDYLLNPDYPPAHLKTMIGKYKGSLEELGLKNNIQQEIMLLKLDKELWQMIKKRRQKDISNKIVLNKRAVIGIFSDVHSLDKILSIVLSELKDCDIIVNLGDIVGYHGDVNEVIKQLNKSHVINLVGNHDEEVLQEKHIDPELGEIRLVDEGGKELSHDYNLDEKSKSFIRKLPLIRRLEYQGKTYAFTHGYSANRKPQSFQHVNKRNVHSLIKQTCAEYNFVGHSHQPSIIVIKNNSSAEEIPVVSNTILNLEEGKTYVFNIGSLATKIDNNMMINYAVLDTEKREIKFIFRNLKESPVKDEPRRKEFTDIKYPEKSKGEWLQTELVKNVGKVSIGNEITVLIFSKSYHGFLVDVIIIKKSGCYEVQGKIQTQEKEIKYHNKKPFFGLDSYDKALKHAVMFECVEVEKFVDFILS